MKAYTLLIALLLISSVSAFSVDLNNTDNNAGAISVYMGEGLETGGGGNTYYINNTNIITITIVNGSAYNSTYATWAYNQTQPAIDYIDSFKMWFYNMTTPFTNWLSTFNFNYNQTYTGGTYNSTYATWAYNQTGVYNYNQTKTIQYPKRATMWHDEALVIQGNPITIATLNGQLYYEQVYQDPPANNDTFTNGFYLAEGNYTLWILGVTHSTRGKIDWYVDNSLIASGQDWYSLNLGYNTLKSVNFSISFSGWHQLKGVVNGRNPSSLSPYYYMSFTKYFIKPAQD